MSDIDYEMMLDAADKRAEAAEARVKELESQLKRMTDWSQNWLMAGNAITGRNDGIALRDDVNRSRALLSAAMK